MIRRTFLSRAIGVAAASCARAAWAQIGHAGMAGMDSMDDMPGMSGMAGHGQHGKSAPAALAAADALPAGAPLAALRTLANESRGRHVPGHAGGAARGAPDAARCTAHHVLAVRRGHAGPSSVL